LEPLKKKNDCSVIWFKKTEIFQGKNMNRRFKRFLNLMVMEGKVNRNIVVEAWNRALNVVVRPKYQLYVKDVFPTMKANNPTLSRRDLMRLIREQWLGLTESERVSYMVIEDKRPSRPNPYQTFQKETYPKIRALQPQLGMGDISKKISEMWKALSEDEKAAYALAASIGVGNASPPVILEEQEEQDPMEEKYEKVMIATAAATDPVMGTVSPLASVEVAVVAGATTTTTTTTKQDSVLAPGVISEYFLKGKKGATMTVDKIRNEDLYLDEGEKKEIQEILEFLRTKDDASLKRLIRENYDVKIPERTGKDRLLEYAYNAERQQKIEKRFNDKLSLVPRSMLVLTKEDSQRLEERKAHLDKMEFWALYLQYRNCFPEDERGENDITKGQLLQGIIDFEKKEMETSRCRIAMGITTC
jgi:hypothetical protein